MITMDHSYFASGMIDIGKEEVIAWTEKAVISVVELKEKRGEHCIVCKRA
jgi:hypothetical protein